MPTNQNPSPPSRSGLRKVTLAGLLAATAVAATAPQASAGTYDVWSCRAPDGSPAPVADAAGGWRSVFNKVDVSGVSRLAGSCETGGVLLAQSTTSGSQPIGSSSIWNFSAPAGTTVAAFELDHEAIARGVRAGQGQARGEIGISTIAQPDPSSWNLRNIGSAEDVSISRDNRRYVAGDVSSFGFLAGCTGVGGERCAATDASGVASARVYRSTVTLTDRDAPSVTAVSGDAVTNGVWAGPTGISFSAADVGGGVHRLGVEIDGQIRSWLPLAEAPCRPWPGTERTFLTPKPCPGSVAGVQQLDTSQLPEGSHTVRIVVEDAAGNQTTAYGPTTKSLRRTDPGPNNGSPAVDNAVMKVNWEGRESASRAIRFNQQPVLRGQLTTPAGQAIKDADVRITITRASRNSPPFERESIRTNSDGRFRWKIPKGSSSRKITLSYRQRVRDERPVVSKSLTLRVSAAVRLTLSRKTARQGQSVKLTGTVVGRPVPGGGKLVELQARNAGGKWITFRNVRSKKSGRFTATYRFRNPGPARFQMRARARKSGDYAYETGVSPVRSIRVR